MLLDCRVKGRVYLVSALAYPLCGLVVGLAVFVLILSVFFLGLKCVLEFKAAVLHVEYRGIVDSVGRLIALTADIITLLEDFRPFFHGLIVLFLSDVLLLQHVAEDTFLLLHAEFIIGYRIVIVGRIAYTDDHGCLGKVDTVRVDPEIILGSALDTVTAVSVIVAVAVEFHDIGFCELFFELGRYKDLERFSVKRSLGSEQIILDDLLSDRASALGDVTSVADELETCAECRDPVNTVVRLESLILNVNVSLLNIVGDLRDINVVIVLISELSDQFAVLIIYGRVGLTPEGTGIHVGNDVVYLLLGFGVQRSDPDKAVDASDQKEYKKETEEDLQHTLQDASSFAQRLFLFLLTWGGLWDRALLFDIPGPLFGAVRWTFLFGHVISS